MENPNVEITDMQVRHHLQLLLNSEDIKNSQVLSKFLEFVVMKKLEGLEDEIKEYTIGVNALGRPSTFNPQLDALVRIHAGRLRRALVQYYQGEGKIDKLVITMPKGGYVPNFEWSHPDGLPYLYAEDGNGKVTHPQNAITSDRKDFRPILAVLPFHDLSPEASREYFVDGIGEQMATDLARFQNISVISYYSTYKYDSAVSNLQELRKTINIDYFLTGTVRFINDLVRLHVQLLFSENAEIVWTETFQRRLTPANTFDVQEEITSQILNVIADDNGVIINSRGYASVLPKPEWQVVQQAIYSYYHYLADYDPVKFHQAIKALEHAVILEPENSVVCGTLSGLYIDLYVGSVIADAELLEKGSQLAHKAVDLDRYSQQGYKACAWAALLAGKRERSIEAIEKCLSLNPKASSMQSAMGLAFICLGEQAKGFRSLLESSHLSPSTHPATKLGFALYQFNKKDYRESLKCMERLNATGQPFFELLSLSIHGKISGSKAKLTENVLILKEHAHSIVGRLVLDLKLQHEILDGLRLAGLQIDAAQKN